MAKITSGAIQGIGRGGHGGRAEVAQFDVAGGSQEDVAGFDVPVDDALAVQVAQALQGPLGHGPDLLLPQRLLEHFQQVQG